MRGLDAAVEGSMQNASPAAFCVGFQSDHFVILS